MTDVNVRRAPRKLIKVYPEGKHGLGAEVAYYRTEDGWVMKREFGKSPHGNDLGGHWVLRDEKGTFIDCDQYRNALISLYNFRVDGVL